MRRRAVKLIDRPRTRLASGVVVSPQVSESRAAKTEDATRQRTEETDTPSAHRGGEEINRMNADRAVLALGPVPDGDGIEDGECQSGLTKVEQDRVRQSALTERGEHDR